MRVKPGSVLHQDLNLLQRVLRDVAGEETLSIRIDSREQFDKLKGFAAEFMPATVRSFSFMVANGPSSTFSILMRILPGHWVAG